MNNKGVTLVELLIVIVVLGIISAFAIPAVGTIVENAERSSVANDALMVENAARLYCQDNYDDPDCDGNGDVLTWSEVFTYVDGLNESLYTETSAGGVNETSDTIATLDANGDWTVTLTAESGETYGYSGIPSADGKGGVTPS
jgi:type IV pilus assembly protein PilA